MSDLPENYTFLRFRLSFSGVFPRERFLCTFGAPRPPKPQKVVQTGWGNSPWLVGGKVTRTIATLPPDKVFRICSLFSGSVPKMKKITQNPPKMQFYGRSHVRSVHAGAVQTHFLHVYLFEKNKYPNNRKKGGGTPQTPLWKSGVFLLFAKSVEQKPLEKHEQLRGNTPATV